MNETKSFTVQNNTSSVVAFRLNGRTFALPLDVIVQILPYMRITPIPHLSPIVEGTINIRGESILAINLRKHLDFEDKSPELYTPFLLLQIHKRKFALIVDEVLDVVNIQKEKLDTLEDMLPDGMEDTPLLQGITYLNEENVLILDPDQLFYDQDLEFPDGIDDQNDQSIPSFSTPGQQGDK